MLDALEGAVPPQVAEGEMAAAAAAAAAATTAAATAVADEEMARDVDWYAAVQRALTVRQRRKIDSTELLDASWTASTELTMRAHLSGILGMSQLLQSTTLSVEQGMYNSGMRNSAKVLLDELSSVVDRLELTAEAFKSPAKPRQEAYDVREVVEDAAKSIAELFKRRVHVSTYLDPAADWAVRGYGQAGLCRILRNLATFFHGASADVSAILIVVQQTVVPPEGATSAREADGASELSEANQGAQGGLYMPVPAPAPASRPTPASAPAEAAEAAVAAEASEAAIAAVPAEAADRPNAPLLTSIAFQVRALNGQGRAATLSRVMHTLRASLATWLEGTASRESPMGTGIDLKLWLASRLVWDAGGITAADDGGSTLHFRLGYSRDTAVEGGGPPRPLALPNAAAAAASAMAPKLLLVEASAPLRRVQRLYLQAWGFRVVELEHIAQVRERLRDDLTLSVVLINVHAQGLLSVEVESDDHLVLTAAPTPGVVTGLPSDARELSETLSNDSADCGQWPAGGSLQQESGFHGGAQSFSCQAAELGGAEEELDAASAEFAEALELKRMGAALGVPIMVLTPYNSAMVSRWLAHVEGLRNTDGHANGDGGADGGGGGGGDGSERGRCSGGEPGRFGGLPADSNPCMWQALTTPVTAQQLLDALRVALSDPPTPSPRSLSELEAPPAADRRARSASCESCNTSSGASCGASAVGADDAPSVQHIASHPFLDELPIRVLVVDDVSMTQKLLFWILEQNQIQCDCACNGFEALRGVQTSDFDVVLMDINMPGMSGLEAAQQIRLYEATAHAGSVHKRLPIIGMTAQAGIERQLDIDTGNSESEPYALDDFLVFPIEHDDVIEKVRKWARFTRRQQTPLINLDVVLMLSRNDHHAMVEMLNEFVRTTLVQLNAVRRTMTAQSDQQMYTACQVIRSVARRFGAVWIARAISHVMWLLTLARSKSRSIAKRQKFDKRMAVGLQHTEDEIIFVSQLTESLHELLSPHVALPVELLAAILARTPGEAKGGSSADTSRIAYGGPLGAGVQQPAIPAELAKMMDSAIKMMCAISEGDEAGDAEGVAAQAEVEAAVHELTRRPNTQPEVLEAASSMLTEVLAHAGMSGAPEDAEDSFLL